MRIEWKFARLSCMENRCLWVGQGRKENLETIELADGERGNNQRLISS